jgi:Transposase, Mutator family
VLGPCGIGRLGRIGLEPAVRYEHSRPGELFHIDVKKRGRTHGGAGKRSEAGRTPTTTQPAPIYTAVDADAAQAALERFDDKWGARFPVITQAWLNAWE